MRPCSTAQALGRHVILPEDDNTGEAGSKSSASIRALPTLSKIAHPEMRQIHRRNKDRHSNA